MLMQARAAKKMSKPKSMRTSHLTDESKPIRRAGKSEKKSSAGSSAFADDLTDTSRRSVKRLRYQGNVQSRLNNKNQQQRKNKMSK